MKKRFENTHVEVNLNHPFPAPRATSPQIRSSDRNTLPIDRCDIPFDGPPVLWRPRTVFEPNVGPVRELFAQSLVEPPSVRVVRVRRRRFGLPLLRRRRHGRDHLRQRLRRLPPRRAPRRRPRARCAAFGGYVVAAVAGLNPGVPGLIRALLRLPPAPRIRRLEILAQGPQRVHLALPTLDPSRIRTALQ